MTDSKIVYYRYPSDLGGKGNNDNTKCVSFMAIKSLEMNRVKGEGVLNFSNITNKADEVEAVITLPTPLNLGDTQGHSWSQETTVGAFEKVSQAFGNMASKLGSGFAILGQSTHALVAQGLNVAGNLTTGAIGVASEIGKAPVVGLISMLNGQRKALVNPGYFQNYTTSTPRTFEFQYTFYSRNQEEAIQVLNIIRSFKMYSSPTGNTDDSEKEFISKFFNEGTSAENNSGGLLKGNELLNVNTSNPETTGIDGQRKDVLGTVGKIGEEISKFFGYMGQPNYWKITFGNKYLDRLLKLDYVVCTSVGVTYGNGSKLEMYKDGIPKIISLTLSFSEVKLKMREDFSEAFNLGDSNVNNEFNNKGAILYVPHDDSAEWKLVEEQIDKGYYNFGTYNYKNPSNK